MQNTCVALTQDHTAWIFTGVELFVFTCYSICFCFFLSFHLRQSMTDSESCFSSLPCCLYNMTMQTGFRLHQVLDFGLDLLAAANEISDCAFTWKCIFEQLLGIQSLSQHSNICVCIYYQRMSFLWEHINPCSESLSITYAHKCECEYL